METANSIAIEQRIHGKAIFAIFCVIALLGGCAEMQAQKAREAAQKEVDQWAARLQADGTVLPCQALTGPPYYGGSYPDPLTYVLDKGDPAKPGQMIASVNELRRLLLTGRYATETCLLRGSQPAKFAEALKKGNLTYFPLETTSNANVTVKKQYLSGTSSKIIGSEDAKSYNADGSSYHRLQYSSEDSYGEVSSSYAGASASYLIVYSAKKSELAYGLVFETEKKQADYCARNHSQRRYSARCLKFYPLDFDNFLIDIKKQANAAVAGG